LASKTRTSTANLHTMMDEVLQLCHLLLRGIRAPLLAKSNNCKTGKKKKNTAKCQNSTERCEKNPKLNAKP
jgi:hypothetical protein